MENVFHEHRNIGPHRHAQRSHAERQHNQRLHRSLFSDELNSLLQAPENRFARLHRQKPRTNHRQRDNRSQKRKRVQPEAPLLAEFRQRDASQRRTHCHRQIELDRIQRNRVRHVLLLDQRRDQCRICRPTERLREARHERQAQDGPHMLQPHHHEKRQRPGARHLYVLRDQQNLPPLNPVRHHPADQRKKKNRNSRQKLVQRQKECGMAQPVNQPALRHDLHPCADTRRTGADPHQPEIAILKCFEDSAQRWRQHGLRADVFPKSIFARARVFLL